MGGFIFFVFACFLTANVPMPIPRITTKKTPSAITDELKRGVGVGVGIGIYGVGEGVRVGVGVGFGVGAGVGKIGE